MLKRQATELIQESQDEVDRKKAKEEEDQQKLLDGAEENITALSKEMEKSSEPHVIVRSVGFTAENGIEIKLDFNDAFIRYLNASGIKGRNNDETIRHWLAQLSHEIMQQGIAEDYVLNGVPEDEVPEMGLEELLGEIQEVQDDEEKFDSGWE